MINEKAVGVKAVELCRLRLLADVRIVPVVLAWDAWEGCRRLGEALAALAARWPEPVLLLASSDLTHYESAAGSRSKDARAPEAARGLGRGGALRPCQDQRHPRGGRRPPAH